MNEKGMKTVFFVCESELSMFTLYTVSSYAQSVNNTHTPSYIMQYISVCMYIEKSKKLTHKNYAFRSFKELKWCGEKDRG